MYYKISQKAMNNVYKHFNQDFNDSNNVKIHKNVKKSKTKVKIYK